jgi:alpha/beta superfamily hydrolase
METLLRYRGRAVTRRDVHQIRDLVARHPEQSRRALSQTLCHAWDWRQANGAPRDMVWCGLMLALERAGHIELPAHRRRPPNPLHRRARPSPVTVDATPLRVSLRELEPLTFVQVRRTAAEATFNSLLEVHHYLGYSQPVGEQLKFLVYAGSRPVALFAWSSAARHLGPRDRFLGWLSRYSSPPGVAITTLRSARTAVRMPLYAQPIAHIRLPTLFCRHRESIRWPVMSGIDQSVGAMSQFFEQYGSARLWTLWLTAVLALCLGGCGGNPSASGEPTGTSSAPTATTRGSLVVDPPLLIASLDAAEIAADLAVSSYGAQLLTVAGTPTCGVDFYYLQYRSVGAAGEAITDSGAMMVPKGSIAQCSGGRPIVLYGHGTNADRNFNIADITNSSNMEGEFIAAMFAAQGYTVVAPNYAGYDTSTLAYHPYLNADQQSKDMIDALTAARSALPHVTTSTTDGGKLFITGYSEGGYVAMATHRAMQAAGMTVTASAPMSGPYALEAFVDAIFYGQVIIGSTQAIPLLVTSYQNAYGNIYQALTDVYEPNYAPNMADVLPSITPLGTLLSTGVLPPWALFSSTPPVTGNATLDSQLAVPSNPVFALGFGTGNLVNNKFRLAYVLDAVANPDGAFPASTAGVPVASNPQNTLRLAFSKNDLRNWTPQRPMLMCGGDQDPTVFFANTLVMQQFWAALPSGTITVVDLNETVTDPNDPFSVAKNAYQSAIAAFAAANGQSAAIQSIHGTEQSYCAAAAREFFEQF